ncbi:hypothetical protein U9M48_038568 [Paspalum notatum var. saurae]|uniref:Uncharacterized protein n=1 Tax=Paspalum notatum var. saurae TaxID=547442 RepID=A0AAQ3XAG3_PASNO
MACSKAVCACILFFLVISSQADARQLVVATYNGKEGACKGGVVVADDGAFRSKGKMATAMSTEQQVGESMPMTTTDSRPTAPGNSPGIGNRGKTRHAFTCVLVDSLHDGSVIQSGSGNGKAQDATPALPRMHAE